MFKLIARDAF